MTNEKQITLKEGFRFQTKLTDLFNRGLSLLNANNFGTKTVVHQLEKANISDKDITDTPVCLVEKEFEFSFEEAIDFLQFISGEKEKLGAAISLAKKESIFDIDLVKATNMSNQKLAETLNYQVYLAKQRVVERNAQKGLKDNNGMQAKFDYLTKETTSYDINKTLARTIINKLTKEADKKSLEIDKYIVTTMIDYVPFCEQSDSLEDAFNHWKESLNKKD